MIGADILNIMSFMLNKTEHAVQFYAAGNEVLSLLKYELLIKDKQQC